MYLERILETAMVTMDSAVSSRVNHLEGYDSPGVYIHPCRGSSI
jgi:hypothetical protein